MNLSPFVGPTDRCSVARVSEEYVVREVELAGGGLRILQPSESAELPDAAGIEWAPIAPYWSVLWRSGVELARQVSQAELGGLRVVELGCGLALPSLAAARQGAQTLATDFEAEALELAERNAAANDLALETARVDWHQPDELIRRAPFDLVLAADVLYEPEAVAPLLDLLPQLAPAAWIADPGRATATPLLDEAARRWSLASESQGVVTIHRVGLE